MRTAHAPSNGRATASLVRLLGPVDVVDDAGSVHAPGSPIRSTLLALLALESGRVVDADQLLDRTWGGRPPDSGLRALRFHISRLRAELDTPDVIVTAGHGYRAEVTTDVDLVQEGLSGDADVTPLLGLWRGPPLVDCLHVTAVEHEQQRLGELRLTLSERHFHDRLADDDTTIVGDLTGLCLEHPTRESLWAILVAAHYQAGDQAQALRTYDQLCRRLRDELGVSPTPQLRDLQRRILEHDVPVPSPPRAAVSDGPGHLPPTSSDLVGRRSDLRRLGGLLDRHRLVTVLGAGGVGKTRLALEAAGERRARHADGVWFCDLSSIDAVDSVPFVVAEVLGVNEHRGRSMTDGLLDWVGDRQMLLVLDNCEQVAPAVRDLVGVLLATSAGVRVLATSREPLRHEAEQRFPLGPLDADTDGVDLFLQRALLNNPALEREPHDAAIVEICRLVDGIPLAVELAAARTAALTPQAIARLLAARHDLLSDARGPRPDRQRTLGATIEWSTSSLTDGQRRTLSRMAIFSGGFDLSAAEAVCAAGSETTSELVDTLTTLVECSLVEMTSQTPTARYRILEPIRQHVLRELPSAQRHELGGRHARWYARRARALQDALLSPDEPAAMVETTVELANLRQAHRWAIEHEPPTAGRLVSGLVHYEISRLHTEITEWFDQTLAVLDPDDPWYHPTLAGATLGWMLQSRIDDVRRACQAIDETRISPFLRDNAAMAAANQARWAGDLGPMERLAERALADGDLFMAVLALGNVGRADAAMSVAIRSGIPSAIAYANMHAARVAAQESRDVDAEQALGEAIAAARSVSAWMPLSRALVQWVKVAERLGLDGEAIERARAESLELYERSGVSERLWTAMVERDSPEASGVGLA